jgi:PAS domain S-box-containing protein
VPPTDAAIQTFLIGDAMEEAPAAVFVSDDDRRLLAVNQYACDLLGYTRDELLELAIEKIAPNSDVEARFRELTENGRLAGRAELRRKDGTLVTVTYRTGETRVGGLDFWVTVALAE